MRHRRHRRIRRFVVVSVIPQRWEYFFGWYCRCITAAHRGTPINRQPTNRQACHNAKRTPHHTTPHHARETTTRTELLGPELGPDEPGWSREKGLWELYAYNPPSMYMDKAFVFDAQAVLKELQVRGRGSERGRRGGGRAGGGRADRQTGIRSSPLSLFAACVNAYACTRIVCVS